MELHSHHCASVDTCTKLMVMKSLVVLQACFILLVWQEQCRSVFGQIPLLQKGSDAFIDPRQRNSKGKKEKNDKNGEEPSMTGMRTFNINSLRSKGDDKPSKKGKKEATTISTTPDQRNATDSTTKSRPILDRLRAKKDKWNRRNHDDASDLSKSEVKYIQSLFDHATDGNSTFQSFFQKKGKKGKKGRYTYDDDDYDDGVATTSGLGKWFGKKGKHDDGDDDDSDGDDQRDATESKKSGKKKKGFSDFFGNKSDKKRKFRGTVSPTTSPAPAGAPTLPLNMNVLPSVSQLTPPQINIPTPIVAPSFLPTQAPTVLTQASIVPTPAPSTAAPTTAVPSSAPSEGRTCLPTVGPCLETVTSIQDAFDASTGGDTIAICASADPIVLETALVLRMPNTKLCCFNENSTETCTLRSQGSVNALDVLTASVRLQDLAFENGVGTAGGNAFIDGGGDHIVDGCEFRNGQATRLGGNLFVQTDGGSLHILDSTFTGGIAGEFGGGLYAINVQELTVENSSFQQNNVTDEDSSGGGIFMVFENATAPGQVATFLNTEFRENVADLGGGFFATQLGEMPRLDVIGCTFTDNQARQAAGAGAIAESLDNYDFRVVSTIGIDNVAPVCQDFLGFFDESTEPECISASRMYPR